MTSEELAGFLRGVAAMFQDDPSAKALYQAADRLLLYKGFIVGLAHGADQATVEQRDRSNNLLTNHGETVGR